MSRSRSDADAADDAETEEERGGEREPADAGEDVPAELTYVRWADGVREGRLFGQACPDCGHVAGAPKGACAHCGSRDLETVELPTTGEVYTVTTINVPPEGFEEPGYQVAVVSLGEARVLVHVDGDAVDIGDEVALEGYVDTDDGHPAPRFSPVEE